MDNGNYVAWWWQRGEFAEQRGDWQASASFEIPGADLLQDTASEHAVLQTPLGEPLQAYDVRCTYDSRIVNAYDFNFSDTETTLAAGGQVIHTFNVPQGYRAVPRRWEIMLTIPTQASTGNFNNISFTSNNAQVPNNGPVIFGSNGTSGYIETFFICEEQTQFGCVVNLGAAAFPGFEICNVYGNLIPVTSDALPFAVANRTN